MESGIIGKRYKSKMSNFDKFLSEVLDRISTIPSDILYMNYFKYSKRKRNQSSINDISYLTASENKTKYNRIGLLKISEALMIDEADSTQYLCININGDHDLPGTWIECNFCSKWRYLPYIYDPSPLIDPWYCALNPKYYGNLTTNSASIKYMHNPCKEPEDLSAGKDQFIFGHFSVGSVVWAKIQGYPDWPTMVYYNSQGKYAEFDPISKEVTYYYVVTLDPKRSKMSRVKVDNIHKFTSFDEINLNKVPKRYWRRLQAAGYEAENALLLSTKIATQIKSSISSDQRILQNVSNNLKQKRVYKRRTPFIHSRSINVDPKTQTDKSKTDRNHTSRIFECNPEKCSSSFLKAITNSSKPMSISNHELHEYNEKSNNPSSNKSLKNHKEIDISEKNNLSVRLRNNISDLHTNDSNLGVDNNENADNNNTDDSDLAIIENENDLNYYSPSFLKPIICNQMTQELICSVSMHENPNEETTDTKLINDTLCKEKASHTRNVNDNDKHEDIMMNGENYFKLTCFDLSFYSSMHNLSDIQISTNHSYRHTTQHGSLNCNKRIFYENVPFYYQYFGDNEV
ncbi:hypothetical protein MN116_006907 [Schistosoma mekongi]|uniref:Zinc finger CW-type PWWP domain protein 1 n=1 Tax=Schistosoma mekongi TaxID=38744 RepID=A0AAE2D2Y5_SCHME|nr:hypothetical protein MN116_006907 [Schistosoma mekongi]